MFKILLASILIIAELLPLGSGKEILVNRLRNRIDQSETTKRQEEVLRDYNTVERMEDFEEISVQSQAAYFVDLNSGQVLINKNGDTKLPVASITKLMTALIVIENADLNDVIEIPPVNDRYGDSSMGLVTGDRLTTFNLLQGLLIPSGSDAALTLAKHVAETEEKFVSMMNEKASLLGLEHTQFTNPVGWDEEGHYSTAHDLTVLTMIALKNSTIREIVSKKTATAVSTTGRKYLLVSTNLLLSNHFLGAKTGTTYAAGECLATYYKDEEKELVGVILDSPSRFTETANLVDQINQGFYFGN